MVVFRIGRKLFFFWNTLWQFSILF